MKLNKFLEAQSDLEAALLVEPRNKDILREVCVVKSCLAINSNGKRSIDDHLLQDLFGKSKIHVQDDGPRRNTPIESGECSDSNSCSGLTSDHNNVISYASGSCFQSSVTQKCDMALDTNMLVSDQQSCINSGSTSTRESSCNLDGSAKVKVNYVDNIGPNRDMNRDHNGVEKTMFQFSKKGGHSVLKIDECTYKKLLDGKEVSFFQQSHLSTMKIRVLKPSISEPDTGSFTSQKKKRKRRRKRKEYLRSGSVTTAGTTTVTDNTKSDILPLPSMILNKSIDCDPTLEKVASSLSHELVNHHALCDPTGANSHPPPYFIFTSSKSKVAKVFHARRKSTRIQSRREESPRRNVYIYPGKFPRSRDVSVSCCRYFPKAQAQILKKRKKKNDILNMLLQQLFEETSCFMQPHPLFKFLYQ